MLPRYACLALAKVGFCAQSACCCEMMVSLTQRHYGEVFATELAGDGDFLPQGPASLGNHMMSSCRGVMAHLESEIRVSVKYRYIK